MANIIHTDAQREGLHGAYQSLFKVLIALRLVGLNETTAKLCRVFTPYPLRKPFCVDSACKYNTESASFAGRLFDHIDRFVKYVAW